MRSPNTRGLSRGGDLIDPSLLEVLGCPLEAERPPFRQEEGLLICTSCGFAFPVVNGIPHLLPEDAISPEKLQELRD
ncbi:MAG: Trm112 family protein [Fimbriimonas sp.]